MHSQHFVHEMFKSSPSDLITSFATMLLLKRQKNLKDARVYHFLHEMFKSSQHNLFLALPFPTILISP